MMRKCPKLGSEGTVGTGTSVLELETVAACERVMVIVTISPSASMVKSEVQEAETPESGRDG